MPAPQNAVNLALPDGYGYVFAVLGASFFMNMFLVINVVRARMKYDIKYPLLYAPQGHKYEKEFNCAQRAHQNTLESHSMVMLMMCVAGLIYPITAASFGAIWCIGRIIYGYG
jgi:glutathione S-transferase